ncbi:MAG: hypothetical protein HFE86_01170 [Clostridiales bacterium]|nr:hypothetical protein [Clostridiales bacterium]
MKSLRTGMIAAVTASSILLSSCSAVSNFVAEFTDENLEKMRTACRYGAREAFLEGMADSGRDFTSKELGEYAALACQYGNHQLVRYLVDQGAGVNTSCRKGNLLIEYLDDLDVEIALYLLEKGADVNSRALDGSLAVEMAVRCGDREPDVQKLLEQLYAGGAQARPETVLNALDDCSLDGARFALQNLRERGKAAGIPKAIECAVDGDWDEVHTLLDKDKPSAQELRRILYSAYLSADMDSIEYLTNMVQECGYDEEAERGDFDVPIISVARHGNIACLKWMQAQGKIHKNDHSLLLHEAAVKPDEKTIRWVYENVPSDRAEGDHIYSKASSLADDLISWGHLELAQELIEANDPTVREISLLILCAATANDAAALRWLLDCAAKWGMPDAQLELSSALGNCLKVWDIDTEIVALLLEHGASANYTSGDITCLQRAIDREYTDIVRLLLEYGADPNITSQYKNEPLLHEAVLNGNYDIVKLLVENGADLSKKYAYGQDREEVTAAQLAANQLSYHIRDYLAAR